MLHPVFIRFQVHPIIEIETFSYNVINFTSITCHNYINKYAHHSQNSCTERGTHILHVKLHRYVTYLDCPSFENKTSRLQIRNSNIRARTTITVEIFALCSFKFQAMRSRRERRVLEFGPRKR